MPSGIGFPQKKVFEHELRFARRKRTSAHWARYPRIDAVRQSSTSNHLKERPAMVQMKLTSAICTRGWRLLWVVGNGAELRV
jgi:hypothetical protein